MPLTILKTENITESNMLEALKKLNDAVQEDRKTIKILQDELSKRDERLLNEIQSLKEVTFKGFHELVNRSDAVEGRLSHIEHKMDEQTDILKQIASNTAK